MIIRVEHRRGYTVISDAALRDRSLSFRATGVLAYLLSLPDGASISGRVLAESKKEGRDAVLAALRELEESGYLSRTRSQTKDGAWQTSCVVRELPSPDFQDSVTENPPPSPENQDSVNQDSVFQDVKAFEVPKDEYLKAGVLETGAVRVVNGTLRANLSEDERTRGMAAVRRLARRPDADDVEVEAVAE